MDEEADVDVLMDLDVDDKQTQGHFIQNGNGFDHHQPLNRDGNDSPGVQSEVRDGDGDDRNGSSRYPLELTRPHPPGSLPTGCCYDDRMKLHVNADFGPNDHHPEDPERIEAIMKLFKKAGLIFQGKLYTDYLDIMERDPTRYMYRIPAREATESEICEVHLPKHFDWVKDLSDKPTAELREMTKEYDMGRKSLYVGSMTFDAALISAGGAIETCKSVVSGRVKNAFAVIRPPGHHAEYNTAMGFCLFNNVPIAAKVCQREYPDLCRKILILDWDVHHGNGIQNIFYSDPNVLYISIHVYQNGNFYPGKADAENDAFPDGNIDKCGHELGLGRNVNIGWHDQGMGDGDYLAAFQKIVMPIAKEFNPDLVIISAGFDAADGDELGGCFVTPACYAHMTHMLMSLAGGKVAVCLEGGYNLQAISRSALAVARTLMGDPPPKMEIPSINKEAKLMLSKVQAYQAPYWNCMRDGIVDVAELNRQGAVRLHDALRAAQRQAFENKHGMIPMFVQREVLYKSYENQVLVTQGWYDKRAILVIIHDPPEFVANANPSPVDNTVNPDNAWVADGVTRYVDWAVSKKFGVFDINIPHYIARAPPKDVDAFTPRMDENSIQQEIKELVCYIWDNCLELLEDTQIFVMGVGFAYLSIKMLLLNRNCKERLAGVVSFVNGNLKPIKSDTDDYLSTWYKENSQVFVSNDHACWSNMDLARKVTKKRFGTVIRSPQSGLNRMMDEHAGDVQKWIMNRIPEEHDDTTEDD